MSRQFPKSRRSLDLQVVETLTAAIRLGAPREQAAAAAGIGVSTLYKWLQEGETDLGRPLTRELVDAVKKAEAESMTNALLCIQRAAEEGKWQAAAWLLERRFPDSFGRRQSIEASVEAKPVRQEVAALSDHELEALIQEAGYVKVGVR